MKKLNFWQLSFCIAIFMYGWNLESCKPSVMITRAILIGAWFICLALIELKENYEYL